MTLVKIAPSAQAALKGGRLRGQGCGRPTGFHGASGAAGQAGAVGPTGPTGAVGAVGAGFFGSGIDGDATRHRQRIRRRHLLRGSDPGSWGDSRHERVPVLRRRDSGSWSGSSINRDGRPDEGSCCGANGLEPHTLGGSGSGGCQATDGEDTANSLGGNGGDGDGEPGTAKPPLLDLGGSTVFDSSIQALTGRTLDGDLVTGGAGGASDSIAANGGGGGGGVVIVITTSPQPAGLSISAAGGIDVGPALDREPGSTRWLD